MDIQQVTKQVSEQFFHFKNACQQNLANLSPAYGNFRSRFQSLEKREQYQAFSSLALGLLLIFVGIRKARKATTFKGRVVSIGVSIAGIAVALHRIFAVNNIKI